MATPGSHNGWSLGVLAVIEQYLLSGTVSGRSAQATLKARPPTLATTRGCFVRRMATPGRHNGWSLGLLAVIEQYLLSGTVSGRSAQATLKARSPT